MGTLNVGASQGCRICGLLQEGISYFESSVGGANAINSISVWGPAMEERYKGSMEIDVWLKNQPPLRLEFFAAEGMNSGLDSNLKGKKADLMTLTEFIKKRQQMRRQLPVAE